MGELQWRKRWVRFALPLLLFVTAPAWSAPVDLHQPSALLINVTEADLNRILRDSFHSNGGPVFEGHRPEVSKGMMDLRYQANLSEPVLVLGDDLSASLRLDILEADLRIGRVERKLLSRQTSCDGLGLLVERERPVDVLVRFHFELRDGDLRLVPESVVLDDAKKGFRLIKPTKCRNSVLPKWLLWALGKPALKRKLSALDGVLLERARTLADDLVEEGGFLRKEWDVDSSEEDTGRVWLYPDFVDSSQGSLFVGLAVSTDDEPQVVEAPVREFSGRADRSFLGISEAFLNAALEMTFAELAAEHQRPSGNLDRIFRSRSVFALVPGLRELESTDDVSFTFHLGRPPRVEFGEHSGGGASVGIRLSGLQLNVWEEVVDGERLLGTLEVDAADIGVLPYRNRLGGVSLEVIENAWSVSSQGLEFNEEVFAAMLQELLFGEMFETGYHPLARDGLQLGDTEFQPTYFDLVAGYLVIDLGR